MGTSVRGTLGSLRRFPILYGVAWAMFIAVVGTLTVSLWAHYHGMSDSHIVASAYIVHCLAVVFGAVSASRASAERGWYYGGLTGLVYAIIMVVIGVLVYNTFAMNVSGLFRVFLMAVIGAFGGIIGVNSAPDDRR